MTSLYKKKKSSFNLALQKEKGSLDLAVQKEKNFT